jgi:arylsulfatase
VKARIMSRLFALLLGCLVSCLASAASAVGPNIVVLLADDMGYGDWPSAKIRTPNLDQLASEGARLTSFYMEPICSPARAALLTGRYPIRDGWGGAMQESSPDGIDPITTIPSKLREAGYTTAAIGKWHLGNYAILPQYAPTRHGFDQSFGVPYSNDMSPLPLMRGETVVDPRPAQAALTGIFTDEAVKFIATNKAKPFFLYLAYTAPHAPLHCAYACVVEEIDRSVGQVMAALRDAGVDGNTLVIFTSDNGPALYLGPGHGSAGPLKGGKRSVNEGGIRVPFIARWPGHIPRRVVSAPAKNVDLYPTFTRLAGLTMATPSRFDGKDIGPLLLGTGARAGSEFMFYTQSGGTPRIGAFRSGDWKVIFDRTGKATQLYDLASDIGETRNLAKTQVARLQSLAARAKQLDTGIPRDHPTKR